MKVLGINGSPHKNGNTAKQLEIMAETLKEQGVEMEIVHIGNKKIGGCLGCNACYRNKDMQCIHKDDVVNEVLAMAKDVDGLVLGAAVHYAGVNGTMKSFLDRFFYVAEANDSMFQNKVGAAVVSVRRTGGSATYSNLQYYFPIAGMQTVGSSYWPVGHGFGKLDVHGDKEAVVTLQNQAMQMAYMIKAKEAAKAQGITLEQKPHFLQNFSRPDLYETKD